MGGSRSRKGASSGVNGTREGRSVEVVGGEVGGDVFRRGRLIFVG
jgi:hypothetical protein